MKIYVSLSISLVKQILLNKDLLEKEYFFLKPYRDDILEKAEVLYKRQMSTGIIKPCYCNFKLLEEAYNNYKLND